MIARPATPADADELVRLRAVLLRSMNPADWNDDWREPTRQSLVDRLGGTTLAGFVIDRAANPAAAGDDPAAAGDDPTAGGDDPAAGGDDPAAGGDDPAAGGDGDPAGDHGLAACALGIVEQRLGNPANPSGRVGYLFSVATDPDQRRRGHSRACVTALLSWYRAHGIRTVDLRASAEAEPLYRDLGFTRTIDPAMRLPL